MTVDFYDDLGAAYFGHHQDGDVEAHVKTAAWREPADLLDRDFALIIVDQEGKEHRKFACFDEGNALMSLWYLQNVAHGLPGNAVKLAEYNIKKVLGEDGELELGTAHEGRVLDERRVYVKTAMMTPPSTKPPMPTGMVSGAAGVSMVGAASPMRPPPLVNAATPMAGGGRTGLGNAATGAKVASADYVSPFDVLRHAQETWADLDPYSRHDLAAYLTKEADSGMAVPDYIYAYGGTTLNPRFERLMSDRREFTANTALQSDYARLGKIAEAIPTEDVVEALYLLDEQAGLTPRYGHRLPDPLLCVYGQTKQAEWSWMHGSDAVNETQLRLFASAPYCSENLGQLFYDDICEEFKKDPLGTFNKMPVEQQIIVARLATQSRKRNDGGFFA